MPLPTTTHSRSRSSPAAGIVPLEWMRPMMKPRSFSVSPRSWPELPAATTTARPEVVSAASIQRVTAALPSCACPLVARLMLIDHRLASSSSPSCEQVIDGVGEPAGVVEREPAVLVLARE